jgi:hypothetical protein
VPERGFGFPPNYGGVEHVDESSTPGEVSAYNKLMRDHRFLMDTLPAFIFFGVSVLPGFFLQAYIGYSKRAVVVSMVGLSIHFVIAFFSMVLVGLRFG